MKKDQTSLNIVMATGGTGGHLFPARALAEELQKSGYPTQIVFLGARLSTNPYLDREQFLAKDICSATFSKKSFFRLLQSLFAIHKGVWQAFFFFRTFRPSVVVGFGSFYSFPSLLAAKLRRIPIVLFESNVLPGKVNRLCSRWARVSAVQFFVSQVQLKGRTVCVKMPLLHRYHASSKEAARDYFGLEQNKWTFLIFGGSQGAQSINWMICGALEKFREEKIDFQVIHMVGSKAREETLSAIYAKHGIKCCVKLFETRMDLAWTAADLSISRAGSGTLAEQIEFATPGILIPFPHGSENHQAINAAFVEEEIGGAVEIPESSCSPEELVRVVSTLVASSGQKLQMMKRALMLYKEKEKKEELRDVILETVGISTSVF